MPKVPRTPLPSRSSRSTPHRFVVISLRLLFIVATACTATSPNQSGQWSSNDADLTIADSSATLRILASGGCFGSYGQFDAPLPNGRFSIPGTYTQLIGAYPGTLHYTAQFSGSIRVTDLSITVAVPDLQATYGPFTLAHKSGPAWPQCLYP